jgi:DNA-binding SARP family transcriptional activator
MTLRVFLAGTVALEHEGRVVGEAALPGLQGRIVLAMLAAEQERAVPRDELALELWPEQPPRTWEPALRAVMSKLRAVLLSVGLDRNALTGQFGAYQLHLPGGSWVDVDAASDSLHRAETFVRAGQVERSCGWALAARAIAGRPLLPGAEGPWVTRRRARLLDVRLRSLEVLARVWVDRGEPGLAVRDAEEALRLEPFRESMYRALMLAHTRAGNRAEALRVYQRCRHLLAEELGTDPSPETEGLYLEILRSA